METRLRDVRAIVFRPSLNMKYSYEVVRNFLSLPLSSRLKNETVWYETNETSEDILKSAFAKESLSCQRLANV